MKIIKNNIVLRAIEPEDLEMLRDMINDEEIEESVLGFSYPISKVEQQNWYERVLKDDLNKKWIIEVNSVGVGVVHLSDIDWRNRSAQIGIKLHSSTRKQSGIGYASLLALQEFAFGVMQLVRLQVKICDTNLPSIHLFTKLGWKKEGVLRKAYFYKYKYHDVCIYSMLSEDNINY